MALRILDDVLLQDLALEAPQCAFDGFAILQMNLSQTDTPSTNLIYAAASFPRRPAVRRCLCRALTLPKHYRCGAVRHAIPTRLEDGIRRARFFTSAASSAAVRLLA